MSDIIDEAQSVVQCRTCSWYKMCVLPLRISEDDIKKQLQSTMPGTGIQPNSDSGVQQLVNGMTMAARNSLLEGCPVFIERLRMNPKLAEKIKKLMQNWSNIED